MAALTLADIVNVSVVVSPVSTVLADFTLGLIMGKSTIISTATRVVVYNSLAEMATAGFSASNPEYVAAGLFFAQNPKPGRVAIGRWDTTPGTETAVVALTACRAANLDWYAFTACAATMAEIALMATYAEACNPIAFQFASSNNADVLNNVDGNVLKVLKAASIRRTLVQYSTTLYAAASIMGYALAASTGQAYTLKFKTEPGVTAEVLTSEQFGTITADYGNAYIARGNTIYTFENGKTSTGVSFDEVLGLDRIANGCQIAIINMLISNPKIPQTELGMGMLKNALITSLEAERVKGFLAEGVWNAATILNLLTGDTLNTGYLVQSELISDQTQADRDARIAPNIYVCLKLAGAIERVAVLSINVNR